MKGRAAGTALLVSVLAACSGGAPGGPVGPSGAFPAEVTRIVDGDTFEAGAGGEPIDVRLLGVNANERGECWSAEARGALERLLAAGEVRVDPAGGLDRFGRTLAYVTAGGVAVNEALLAEGHALTVTGAHPRLEAFLSLEEEAYAAGRGWWAPDACGPPGEHRDIGVEARYDPPGPDGENLGEELVRLRTGGGAVDLTGWTLRDESSSHRYRFPDGAALEPGAELVVRTGCGTDGPSELFWCAGGPVWSNDGDAVLLLDRSGNVAARSRYSGS